MQNCVRSLWRVQRLYRPVIRSVDIAWLTGLLEGEGTFVMSERSMAVAVNMIDRNIIERAAQLMKGRV